MRTYVLLWGVVWDCEGKDEVSLYFFKSCVVLLESGLDNFDEKIKKTVTSH